VTRLKMHIAGSNNSKLHLGVAKSPVTAFQEDTDFKSYPRNQIKLC